MSIVDLYISYVDSSYMFKFNLLKINKVHLSFPPTDYSLSDITY